MENLGLTLSFYASVGFLCLYAVYQFLHIATIIYGQFILHVHKKRDYTTLLLDPPGVSIIKPIIGFNDKFKSNLETFFQLKYPKFELLICLGEHENPPSLRMVEELREQYPSVDCRVFIGASEIGINPKINNIYKAYMSTKYDLAWVSDSRMMVYPETLLEMASSINNPKVGAVHQVPVVGQSSTLPDYLEKMYFGTQHARIYIFSNLLGTNCLTGMSCMVRKSILDDAGGLEAFSVYLAEDYFIGKTVIDSGMRMKLSALPGLQVISGRTFKSFKDRLIRWGKLRSRIIPWAAVLEPTSECIPQGVLASLAMWTLFGIHPVIFFLLHCALWFTYDYILMYTLEDGFPSSFHKILSMWILRELFIIPIMVLTQVTGWTVEWGGNKYRLKLGGEVVKL